jgi:hypothetical protein
MYPASAISGTWTAGRLSANRGLPRQSHPEVLAALDPLAVEIVAARTRLEREGALASVLSLYSQIVQLFD